MLFEEDSYFFTFLTHPPASFTPSPPGFVCFLRIYFFSSIFNTRTTLSRFAADDGTPAFYYFTSQFPAITIMSSEIHAIGSLLLVTHRILLPPRLTTLRPKGLKVLFDVFFQCFPLLLPVLFLPFTPIWLGSSITSEFPSPEVVTLI